MITSSAFKRHQSAPTLDDIHGPRDYYWYLYCNEVRAKVHRPLGQIVQRLGKTCLDIGCGKGWLSEYIGDTPYKGIDASQEAIKQAIDLYPNRRFEVARFEEYPDKTSDTFGTLIFGNMLWLLVKPEYYTTVFDYYVEKLYANYVVLYDLQKLKTKDIDQRYKCIEGFSVHLNIKTIPEVKRYRQIKVYECE